MIRAWISSDEEAKNEFNNGALGGCPSATRLRPIGAMDTLKGPLGKDDTVGRGPMFGLDDRPTRLCDGLSRREWLRVGGLSVLGLGLGAMPVS
jgi:hypothetical protein